jgi:integrase
MPLRLKRYPKRSNYWYVRGTVRGQNVFETTGTDDREAAEAIRIKRENQLLQQSVFGVGATVTFAEAALSYLEAGGEARFLGKKDERTGRWTLLIGHFGNTPISIIGQAEIDDAARKLYPEATAGTRKRQVYVPMSSVLAHAARKGWRAPLLLRHPKVKQPETKFSTLERLEKLLPHCSPKIRRLVVFLAFTGARISEAIRLDWEHDINLQQRTAILRRTKNGKPRTVHLHDSVLIQLATVPENERKGLVFRWASRHAVYRPLRRACRLAGVEYLPPHQQGRHTFATWLRQSGRDLIGVKNDGGWDSLQSVERYAHFTPGETVDAVNRLPVVQNGCSEKATTAKPRLRKANS